MKPKWEESKSLVFKTVLKKVSNYQAYLLYEVVEERVCKVTGWHSVVAVHNGKLGRVLEGMLKKNTNVKS